MYRLEIKKRKQKHGWYADPESHDFRTLKELEEFISIRSLDNDFYDQCCNSRFDETAEFDFELYCLKHLPKESEKYKELMLAGLRIKHQKFIKDYEDSKIKAKKQIEADEREMYEQLKLKYGSQ